MDPDELSKRYPGSLSVGTQPTSYSLVTSLCAVSTPDSERPGEPVFARHDGRSLKIVEASGTRSAANALPVYQQESDLGVATGVLFVRLVDGLDIESFDEELSHHGLRLRATLSYARNAGWVKSSDGDPAAALLAIPALLSDARVAHVEPELLRSSARKQL